MEANLVTGGLRSYLGRLTYSILKPLFVNEHLDLSVYYQSVRTKMPKSGNTYRPGSEMRMFRYNSITARVNNTETLESTTEYKVITPTHDLDHID